MSKEIRRFVVLRFGKGWVVWDNLKARVSDGVYMKAQDAVETSTLANDTKLDLDREWLKAPTQFKDSL